MRTAFFPGRAAAIIPKTALHSPCGMIDCPPMSIEAIRVCAAVVRKGGNVLLTSRPPGAHLAGKWEFPGGKLHAGETPGECLRREIREELAMEVAPLDLLREVVHCYAEKTVALEFYRALASDQELARLRPLDGQGWGWFDCAKLAEIDFVAADLPMARFIM